MACMDLKKAYDRIDRDALWQVLKIYGVGGDCLKGYRGFTMRVKRVLEENLVWVRVVWCKHRLDTGMCDVMVI